MAGTASIDRLKLNQLPLERMDQRRRLGSLRMSKCAAVQQRLYLTALQYFLSFRLMLGESV